MSILGFLKRIKAPSFQDEFIQDPAERLIEEGKAGKTGRMPVKFDTEEDRKRLQKGMDEFNEDVFNPSSEASPLWNDPWDR
jgi:hypothetical protein